MTAQREATLVWVGSVAITAIMGVVAMFVPLVAQNLLALVAATFLYLPAWAIWRRGLELTEYGLTADPIARGLLLTLVVTVVTLPLHGLGYHVWTTTLTNAEPTVERSRLVRFSRDLDHRPRPGDAPTGLHAFVEADRFVVLWTGDGDTRVELRVEPQTVEALHALRATDDGRLLRTGRAVGLKPRADGADADLRPGQGLALNVDGVETLRLDADAEILQGRWSIPTDAPLETERSPWWWLLMLGTQLVLVAIPEEWFFRGYLQKRLHEAWGARKRILGVELGWGWIVSSAMFALGHLILDPRPERLAVFFPSLLFGYMRARTGSIMAGAIFHALCNVWIQGLGYIYYG